MQDRITPQMVIEHHTRRRGIHIEEIGIRPIVVVSWGQRIIEWLAKKTGADPSPHWMYSDRELLYVGEINGQEVSFVRLPIGAPGSVARMEEMVACGAKTIIGLGWAGSLQPDIPIGSYLIPSACTRQEGTSPHYLDDESDILPDDGLAAALQGAAESAGCRTHIGLHWTTDAPYREPVDTIEAYRRRGVLGVDMETSAMYALGVFRGVRVANLLVISDEVWREWNPAFGTDALVKASMKAGEIVLRCVSDLIKDQVIK